MIRTIIVAVAKNRAIGKDNDLIWNLPRDMKFFKDTTKGHHVIMGRKNYDSIPEKYRPLPGRPNVIATTQKEFTAENCDVVHSVEKGLELAEKNGEEEVFIIGGGQIYKYVLDNDLVDKMYITWIDEVFDADCFFPEYNSDNWLIEQKEFFQADEKNPHDFEIVTYRRKN